MARVGPHVNRYHASGTRPGITAHIEAARQEAEAKTDFRIGAAAIFVGGPRGRQIILGDEEVTELREYISRTGICVIAHSSYTAVPWQGDPDAAQFIREEADVCQAAGVTGLVVHLPKLPVAAVMKYIARLHNPSAPDVRIYLETPAVRPNESYYETPAKLAELFGAIRSKLDPTLLTFGLCVDSAHLWTCGVDVRSYGAADAWLMELEALADVIPPTCIMLHVNDSERGLGVGPDTHAPLAAGKIWGEYRDALGESGLAAFMDYAQRHETVCILERKPKEALLGDYLAVRELIRQPHLG